MVGMAQRTAVDGDDGIAYSRGKMVRIVQSTAAYTRECHKESRQWRGWHRGQPRMERMAEQTARDGGDFTEDSSVW